MPTETKPEGTQPETAYAGDAVADDIGAMLDAVEGVVNTDRERNLDQLVESTLNESQQKVETQVPPQSEPAAPAQPAAPPVEERKAEASTPASSDTPAAGQPSTEEQLARVMEQNRKLLALLNEGAVDIRLDTPAGVEVPPAEAPKVSQDETEARRKAVEEYNRKLEEIKKAQDLTDEQFEEVRTDKTKFMEYLATRDAYVAQQTYQGVPDIVTKILDTRTQVSNFFALPENKDIVGVSNLVARQAVMLQNDNPSLSNLDALKKAAENTRKRLELGALPSNSSPAQQKPVFAQPPAAPRSPSPAQPEVNKVADDLDEMDKIIERRGR